jgi:predicted TPR repeat methyltransferase
MSRRQLRAKNDAYVGEKRSPSDFYAAALRHFLARRFEAAEQRCQRALALDPKHADSLHLLGLVHAQTNRIDSGVEMIAAAIKANPNNHEYFSNLGNLLQRQNRLEEARKSFDLAIKLAPNLAGNWLKLGNLLKIQGSYDEALLTYNHALTLDSANVEAANRGASLLFELRRYEEALAWADRSLGISPNDAEVVFLKGRCLSLLGRLGEMAASFRRTVELAPDSAFAWYALGTVCVRLGERDEAIAALRKSRELDPSDSNGAGVWLMRLGADELSEMSPAYVRKLFDLYAPNFDTALVQGLGYRGPALLVEAVTSACRALEKRAAFNCAIDLGCGTGLAGTAFEKLVDRFIGIDLSPGMIEKARATGRYAELEITDMVQGLRAKPNASAELILSADAMIYVGDLLPVLKEAARVLADGGLLAFTLERHEGEGVLMGEGLRYTHSESYVRTAIESAGLALLQLAHQSTRNEKGAPVPSLIVVANKS